MSHLLKSNEICYWRTENKHFDLNETWTLSSLSMKQLRLRLESALHGKFSLTNVLVVLSIAFSYRLLCNSHNAIVQCMPHTKKCVLSRPPFEKKIQLGCVIYVKSKVVIWSFSYKEQSWSTLSSLLWPSLIVGFSYSGVQNSIKRGKVSSQLYHQNFTYK